MELRISDSHGLPERSVISINSRPTRQTLLTRPCDQPFKLSSSPWPLCIDIFRRLGRTGATASLQRADANNCYKVLLDSFDERPMSITFRMQAAAEDKDTDKRIEEYFLRHKVNAFLQENFDLLLESRPDDPFEFLAKRFREAALREAAAPPVSKATSLQKKGVDFHQAKSVRVQSPPPKLRAKKVLSEISDSKLMSTLLKAEGVTPRQRARKMLAACANDCRLEVALGRLPSLYEAPAIQMRSSSSMEPVTAEVEASKACKSSQSESLSRVPPSTIEVSSDGSSTGTPRNAKIHIGGLSSESRLTKNLSQFVPNVVPSIEPQITISCSDPPDLSKLHLQAGLVEMRSDEDSITVSKSVPVRSAQDSTYLGPAPGVSSMTNNTSTEQGMANFMSLVPTHVRPQPSSEQVDFSRNLMQAFGAVSNTFPDQGSSDLAHLVPNHMRPESSKMPAQELPDLAHLVPTHILPEPSSQYSKRELSLVSDADLSHLVPTHMETNVFVAAPYPASDSGTEAVNIPQVSPDLLHLVPSHISNMAPSSTRNTRNHEIESQADATSELSHLVPTHLENRSRSETPSQSDLEHLIPTSENSTPLEVTHFVPTKVTSPVLAKPPELSRNDQGTMQLVKPASGRALAQTSFDLNHFLSHQNDQESPQLVTPSAGHALAQASFDLNHHLSHLGSTPRTDQSVKIHLGHLSEAALRQPPKETDNADDAIDLAHLVPTHIVAETQAGTLTSPILTQVASSNASEMQGESDLSHLIPTNVKDVPALLDLALIGSISEAAETERTPMDTRELEHLVPNHIQDKSSADVLPGLDASFQRDLNSTVVDSDTPRMSQFLPVFGHAPLPNAALFRLPEDEDTPRLSDFIPAGSSAASTADSIDLDSCLPEQHQLSAKMVLDHTPRLSSFVP